MLYVVCVCVCTCSETLLSGLCGCGRLRVKDSAERKKKVRRGTSVAKRRLRHSTFSSLTITRQITFFQIWKSLVRNLFSPIKGGLRNLFLSFIFGVHICLMLSLVSQSPGRFLFAMWNAKVKFIISPFLRLGKIHVYNNRIAMKNHRKLKFPPLFF